jgi:hypothetical protein
MTEPTNREMAEELKRFKAGSTFTLPKDAPIYNYPQEVVPSDLEKRVAYLEQQVERLLGMGEKMIEAIGLLAQRDNDWMQDFESPVKDGGQ